MLVRVYASGTNVQRLAKCSKSIDGVIYTSYAELEQTEPGMVRRRFFCTEVDTLKQAVEALDAKVQPSWTKIWGRPNANSAFLTGLLRSLVGDNDDGRTELNLTAMTGEAIDCFMLLVSANKKEMGQFAEIIARAIPDWAVVVLNGEHTTNREAEALAERRINEARVAKKRGVIFVANQMGSRSFSVPEIQATVIAYDRGSIDATQQKVSRCLTPTKKERKLYDGVSDKTHGAIVDLSFDPNRAENVERLLLEEAIMVQRSGLAEDFASAVKYVLAAANVLKMNEYGHPVEVTEADLFAVYGDNDVLLRVADIAVDVAAAVESGVFDILAQVNADGKGSGKDKKPVVGDDAINHVRVGDKKPAQPAMTDKEKRDAERVINAAIRALNMSATSVFNLAGLQGESYRECIATIAQDTAKAAEFFEFFGVPAAAVTVLLDQGVLNEAILDVIVQNSKPKAIDNLFL